MPSTRSGRRARKNANTKGSAESSSKADTDAHHNLSNPCSSLAEQIVREIFPETALVENEKSNNDRAKQDAAPAQEETPLLGRMIRHYLLNQRQTKLQVNSHNPVKEDSSGGKKKRKRKKRKQKYTASVEGEPSTSIATAERESEAKDQDDPSNQEAKSTCASVDTSTSEPCPENDTVAETKAIFPEQVRLLLDGILGQEGNKITAACAIPNRDLVSFVSFLTQRFQQQYKEHQTKGKKKTKDSPDTVLSSHVIPTVHAKDLTLACDSIGCRVCRSAVEAHRSSAHFFASPGRDDSNCVVIRPADLEVENCNVSSSLSLPVSGLVNEFKASNDVEVDRAFDYVAMEEGGVTSENPENNDSGLRLSFHVVGDSKNQLFQMKPTSSQDTDGSAGFPLVLRDIEEMIRLILLPCGLIAESDTCEEYELTEKELSDIKRFVDSQESAVSREIEEIGKEIRSVQARLDNVETSNPAQPFDANTPKDLMECDSDADKLMEQMWRVLLNVTVTHHSLRAYQPAGANDFFSETMACLWRVYEAVATASTEEVLTHEGRVMQLANRPGSVPQMFLNSAHRQSHHKMVQKKLEYLYNLHGHFTQLLFEAPRRRFSSQNEPPTMLTKLYTHQGFYSTLHGQRDQDDTDWSKLDDVCVSVLHANSELARAAKCASVSDFIASQEDRYKSLRKVIMELNTLIDEACSTKLSGSAAMLGDLRREFEQLTSKETSLDGEESNRDDTDPDVAELVSRERRNLQEATSNIVTQWRLVRCLLVKQDVSAWICSNSDKLLPRRLPTKLIRWMETRHLQGTDWTGNGNTCDGGGGKRRVACIITGLLYRWLCDRCMEWHAELTQQELLEAMDDGTLNGNINAAVESNSANVSSTARPGKKAKKRRDRKSKVVPSPDNETSSKDQVKQAGVSSPSISPEPVLRDDENETASSEVAPNPVTRGGAEVHLPGGQKATKKKREKKSRVVPSPGGAETSSKGEIKQAVASSPSVSPETVAHGNEIETVSTLVMPNPVAQSESEVRTLDGQKTKKKRELKNKVVPSSGGNEAISKEEIGQTGFSPLSASPETVALDDAKNTASAGVSPNPVAQIGEVRTREGQHKKASKATGKKSLSKPARKQEKRLADTKSTDKGTSKSVMQKKGDAKVAENQNKDGKKKRKNKGGTQANTRTQFKVVAKEERKDEERLPAEEVNDGDLTEPPSRVGVVDYDGSNFQSAEEYLVGRFTVALNQAHRPRSKEAPTTVFM